ncbi:MAG: MFS transporter [Zetaproteobacteria bacterium]|nr:MAG: MFS transporter [Zetaproteobacteria bacterium]
MKDRAKIVHENFLRRVKDEDLPHTDFESPENVGLSNAQFVEIFESQALSRRLDMEARDLQAIGEGFYTIGSSGHEGNAAVSAALRIDDMAFLHYRDAAFFIQRAKKLPGQTPLWDILLSLTASSEDPISAGRHKVLGSKALHIPPQTSTIASHLPKAVGAAHSIGLNTKIEKNNNIPHDAIIMCSFGDASVNHSTAQGAFNAAGWAAYKNSDLPLLFLCEDNDIGISTPTPKNWIYNNFKDRPGLKYFYCNGLNALETYKVTKEAAAYARINKAPVFLHKKCVRLYGHAGADVQTAYMSKEKVERTEAQDPLLHTANLLIQNNILTATQILDIYNEIGERIERAAQHVIKRPKLTTSLGVQESIIPDTVEDIKPVKLPTQKEREQSFGREIQTMKQPQHMARLINWTLHDLMLSHDNIVMAGEDIGPKGGVYNVTAKLHSKFGSQRVINTLLDEQTILGLAIGMAHNGILPIPEIQFLAYLHNAEDQLRGEAATLSFFSNKQYTNPMIIRVAGLAYQRGFGGHFHNDNSFAVLRDIPGIIIACPSNGADAIEMMRECVRLAREEQRIIVFLEPIALYMTRDLHAEKDGLWTFPYIEPKDAKPIALGDLHVEGKGTDLCILTYGNGYYLSRQAAKILEDEHNIKLRVIDIRWLAPLNETEIIKAIKPCKHVLIVDECRRSGSISEALMTMAMENLSPMPKIKRLTADDCFIPLGKAYAVTLPSKDIIIQNALDLLK